MRDFLQKISFVFCIRGTFCLLTPKTSALLSENTFLFLIWQHLLFFFFFRKFEKIILQYVASMPNFHKLVCWVSRSPTLAPTQILLHFCGSQVVIRQNLFFTYIVQSSSTWPGWRNGRLVSSREWRGAWKASCHRLWAYRAKPTSHVPGKPLLLLPSTLCFLNMCVGFCMSIVNVCVRVCVCGISTI